MFLKTKKCPSAIYYSNSVIHYIPHVPHPHYHYNLHVSYLRTDFWGEKKKISWEDLHKLPRYVEELINLALPAYLQGTIHISIHPPQPQNRCTCSCSKHGGIVASINLKTNAVARKPASISGSITHRQSWHMAFPPVPLADRPGPSPPGPPLPRPRLCSPPLLLLAPFSNRISRFPTDGAVIVVASVLPWSISRSAIGRVLGSLLYGHFVPLRYGTYTHQP